MSCDVSFISTFGLGKNIKFKYDSCDRLNDSLSLIYFNKKYLKIMLK